MIINVNHEYHLGCNAYLYGSLDINKLFLNSVYSFLYIFSRHQFLPPLIGYSVWITISNDMGLGIVYSKYDYIKKIPIHSHSHLVRYHLDSKLPSVG